MKHVISVMLLIIIAIGCYAQTATSYFTKDGTAIGGYDPVAYFTDSAAIKGDSKFSYTWEGTKWQFKNQANMDAFKKEPVRYAPQYGGYCAFGTCKDHKSPTDPAAFTIVYNKLYLNYNPAVKAMWIKDTKANIEKADSNWVHLKDKY